MLRGLCCAPRGVHAQHEPRNKIHLTSGRIIGKLLLEMRKILKID
jgi:hypothetical protein